MSDFEQAWKNFCAEYGVNDNDLGYRVAFNRGWVAAGNA
jgi:hypothetical protein